VPEPDHLRLPRADEAEIPEDKLRGYALALEHPTGGHKARVFASALGIEQSDWTFLRDQILDRVVDCPVTAIRPKPPYGMEYEVRVDVDGRNGETHRIITGWLVAGEEPPRLITAYVELPRRT
jgi:hypothetical protein